MIETLAVAVILLLSVAFLIFTFFSYTSLLFNLAILLALYSLITKDLREKDNHKYYIASLLLTAIFFIFSTTGFASNILAMAERMLLSVVTVSILIIYISAYLTMPIYQYYIHLIAKHRR